MKQGKRAFQSVSSALLAVLLVTAAAVPPRAVTREEIDALMAEADGVQEQQAALEAQISEYSYEIGRTLEQKAALDAQIAELEGEVARLEAQIADCQARIEETERQLGDARERETEKYEQFRQRVRAMEEEGRMNYWMILFRATSFVDFLTRLDFVTEIMESDRRVMDELRALQAEIAGKQRELEAERLELETASAECLSKKAELDARREAANQLIIELEASRTEAESDRDILVEEAERIQAEILRLSEQLAREEEEARIRAEEEAAEAYRALREQMSVELDDFVFSEGGGGYIWPVNSRRVTSPFGNRTSPGGIGSTNHKGIDIGGVGYGTPVHAAKAGTVIISQYSNSYGNFVVVSHGSGNTTLYAHMSSRLVEAGQAVSQGDILGLTGSTGHSTGPHLHFEITVNGTRINPLIYLFQPT
ncbi:MAG: peptidoglycan DD-metalloendopeptidase family protein [Oscillibacter sp.]|nr:peptidoglycan DD-metalloendopeptidase family protein [Oscillibacter sp.]